MSLTPMPRTNDYSPSSEMNFSILKELAVKSNGSSFSLKIPSVDNSKFYLGSASLTKNTDGSDSVIFIPQENGKAGNAITQNVCEKNGKLVVTGASSAAPTVKQIFEAISNLNSSAGSFRAASFSRPMPAA